MVSYGIVHVVGNEALTVTVPEAAGTALHRVRFPQGLLRLTFLSCQQFDPRTTDRWAQGLHVIGNAGCTGGDVTKLCA
jgi:hypothetical protein